MKKETSNLGIIVFLVLLVAVVCTGFLIKYASTITKFDPEGPVGNTPGNLLNLGLFCEYDGNIYFSNHNDQGMLYCTDSELKNFRLVCKDNARYINADCNYLYYSRNNNLKDKEYRSILVFYNNGLFRIKPNGKGQHMLWDKPIGSVLLFGNKLFYQYYMNGSRLSIHSMGIDGEKDFMLSVSEYPAVSISNERLYYQGSGQERFLNSVSIYGGTERTDAEVKMYQPIVCDSGVYYIDIEDHYKLCLSNIDGSDREVICPQSCATYNVSRDGRYVYFQTDGTAKNGIYVYDSEENVTKLVHEGNYKWINLAGGYCFFYSFDETKVYAYKDGQLNYFNPPVLK